jgi:ribonucleoside-diphosphate reductase alpha chain
MPEAATVEEIEKVYMEGWKLGLKAIAIYRDNSKRSQPLSTGKKKDGDAVVSAADSEELEKLRKQLAKAQVEAGLPHRRRLPAERSALTHKFDIAGHEGYITVGLYPDGQPGEIFLKMAKEGSTVSGLMDTLATTISVALQYGVPLRDLVNKFAHVRFEPSGFTGNQEIPIAKSIVDYIFRWLGSRFLIAEDQQNLGLQPRVVAEEAPPSAGLAPQGTGASTAQSPAAASQPPSVLESKPETKNTESDAPKATAVAAEPAKTQPDELKVIAANGHANGQATANGNGNGKATGNGNGGGGPSTITLNLGQTKVSFQTQADAPSCADCGSIMIRNGSCYKCLNCGSTSGCS